MKRRALLIGVASCAVVLIAFLAGCGGSAESSTTLAPAESSATTVVAAGTTGTTTATTTAPTSTSAAGSGDSEELEGYKGEMTAWVDEYDAKLNVAVEVLVSITDPMNVTEEQIQGAKDFVELTEKAASDLQDIEPPAALVAMHKAYADGLTLFSTGMKQYLEAIEGADQAAFQAAMASLGGVADSLEQAETALEEALGITLTSD